MGQDQINGESFLEIGGKTLPVNRDGPAAAHGSSPWVIVHSGRPLRWVGWCLVGCLRAAMVGRQWAGGNGRRGRRSGPVWSVFRNMENKRINYLEWDDLRRFAAVSRGEHAAVISREGRGDERAGGGRETALR